MDDTRKDRLNDRILARRLAVASDLMRDAAKGRLDSTSTLVSTFAKIDEGEDS